MEKNRRNFLKLTSFTGVGIIGAGINAGIGATNFGQFGPKTDLNDKKNPDQTFVPLNRFPRTVHEYFVRHIRRIEDLSNKRRNKIQTKSEAEAYVHEVRSKIQKCFGPWPEKTPLNAQVTGILAREAYTIEKVIFESRPGFPVTANLYIPKGRKFPLPAVVGTVGHSKTSKAYDQEQSFAQGLAHKGYVVLTFDPIGQGERIQSLSDDLKPRHGIGTAEHIYTGNPLIVTGEIFSTWFAWDGIRAVDYLLTRKEVDPQKLGVTGNSGGGMQTTFLCAVEPRLSMAAPCCWVTTFRRNLENEEPQDTEQYLPHMLGMGLDQSDFIAAMAPKPVIILGQEKDFFDIRGTREAFSRLQNLYKLLGAEKNIQFFTGSDYHGYHKENREAMYKFFNNVTGISSLNKEPILTLEKEETLWCTSHGKVGESQPETVFSFMKHLSVSLKKKRVSLQEDQLKKAVVSILKLPLNESIPDFRILRPGPKRFYPKNFVATYVVETEPDIFALVYKLSDTDLFSQLPRGQKKALLYISHLSADEELRSESFLTELIKNEPDSAIFACDVRGIGESKPNTTSQDFLAPTGSDYFYAAYSNMLDYPYVGQKTNDVLSVIRLLKSYGHEEIHLVGKGWGAIPATFAALLSKNVTQVTLKNALTSYADIAENEEYNWPLSSLLPGVLKLFDMPDCYKALAKKELHITEPWGAKAGS